MLTSSVLRELRTLFNDMITSPGSYVIPGQELARLTLISPSNEAAIRRRSTIPAGKPAELGEINGMPIMGPLGPPQAPIAESESWDPTGSPPVTETEKPHVSISDGDSDATLVSDNTKHDAAVTVQTNNKENAPPSTDIPMTDPGNETAPESTTAAGETAADHAVDADSASPKQQTAEPVTPPSQPLPIPPRPVPQVDEKNQLIEEVEIGAQQDVTEVINNVLFQSQCAIRPLGIASDGEQLDQIKESVPCYSPK